MTHLRMILALRGLGAVVLGAGLLAACGSVAGDRDPMAGADAAPAVGDASGAGDDAAAVSLVPNIAEALDCGAAPPVAGGNSTDLQRHALDLSVFPDALCNNGDVAVFYYRPFTGEQNRNRWVINLNGGGGCQGGQGCADRWCWCRSLSGPNGCPYAAGTTNFSMGNMNGDTRPAIIGEGILLRGDADRPNPIGDYNQVRVVYCSSDTWAGTRRAVTLEAKHPRTGQPVTYSIHFLGAKILDATLATLRADGVASPTYTATGPARAMPDLDDAVEVILSGDSAGGAGVIQNLDRVAALLRAKNRGCGGGGACPLEVRGLMDAAVGPDHQRLDHATSTFAEKGIDTYDKWAMYQQMVVDVTQGAIHEESCLAAHAGDGKAYLCSDTMHLVRHHVTTPFFVRMALLDSLNSDGYIEPMLADPVLGVFTLPRYGIVLQRELSAFPAMPSTAEEGSAMKVAPGIFAPACMKHDTIHSNADVYGVTITPPGGTPKRLFDVFEAWRKGTGLSAVLTQTTTREDTVCQD